MAARVALVKQLSGTGNSESIVVRLARPPFLFTSPQIGESGVAWTGTVAIQMTLDDAPQPNNGGGVTNSGVTDANANWQTIVAALAPGTSVNWDEPLYRIRVNGTNVTGGTAPDVYMLEQVFNPDTASGE